MNTYALAIGFLMCAVGLTIAFVMFEPMGLVLDGLGLLVFLYGLHGKREEAGMNWKEPKEEMNKCGSCSLFGSDFCPRHEGLLNAVPCEKFHYKPLWQRSDISS